MNDVVHMGTLSEKKRKQQRYRSIAFAVGPLLALIIYFLLIEQYGFSFLAPDNDDVVIEAAP